MHKLADGSTTEQRKAQNRLAQRRFRERAKAKLQEALRRQQAESRHKQDEDDDGQAESRTSAEEVKVEYSDGQSEAGASMWKDTPSSGHNSTVSSSISSYDTPSDTDNHDTKSITTNTFTEMTSSDPFQSAVTTTKATSAQSTLSYIQSFLAAAQSLTNGSGRGAQMLLLPTVQFLQSMYLSAARMGIPAAHLDDFWYISAVGKGWNAWQSQRQLDGRSPSSEKPSSIAPLQLLSTFNIDEAGMRSHLRTKQLQTSRCRSAEEEKAYALWNWDHVATNMHPTSLQLSIEHHPYIDVGFPWPAVRDKILLLVDSALFSEEDLCRQAVFAQTFFGEPAFTVWGDDPTDEMAWEVSESFAQQWWFLLDRQILRRTNWWRAQRGLRAIVDDRIM